DVHDLGDAEVHGHACQCVGVMTSQACTAAQEVDRVAERDAKRLVQIAMHADGHPVRVVFRERPLPARLLLKVNLDTHLAHAGLEGGNFTSFRWTSMSRNLIWPSGNSSGSAPVLSAPGLLRLAPQSSGVMVRNRMASMSPGLAPLTPTGPMIECGPLPGFSTRHW